LTLQLLRTLHDFDSVWHFCKVSYKIITGIQECKCN
jgi:hypothetical protein